jgi:hypothetical protein
MGDQQIVCGPPIRMFNDPDWRVASRFPAVIVAMNKRGMIENGVRVDYLVGLRVEDENRATVSSGKLVASEVGVGKMMEVEVMQKTGEV